LRALAGRRPRAPARAQAARAPLLRLLARLVAQGVLVTVCLRRLVACLAPPRAPPASPEPASGPWQPSAADVAVQDAVVAALAQARPALARRPLTHAAPKGASAGGAARKAGLGGWLRCG